VPVYRLEVVAGTGAQSFSRFRTGDSTAANNAGIIFNGTSSGTAASRRTGIILDADGADGIGLDYLSIDKFGSSGEARINQLSNAPLTFFTNNTERARITNAGDFFVGTTGLSTIGSTVGAGLYRDGFIGGCVDGAAVGFFARRTSNGAVVEFRRDTTTVGTVSVTTTATTYNTSSDQRLKQNIVDAPSASESIDAIQIRSFDWKADGSHQKYGVIAQELESIAPEAVSKGEKEEDMWGVDYSKLVPMLIKEVQSLRARVAQLEGN
jgi:hypothetical protein